MITRALILYLLCFLASNSYSNTDDRDLSINFEYYETFVNRYHIKEIIEARAQIVTVTKDGPFTRFSKENCHQSYYNRFDKNEHFRPYTLKNNFRISLERNTSVNLGSIAEKLDKHRSVLKSLIKSSCKIDSYITVLLKGLLKNGHEFRSDFTIILKRLNRTHPDLYLLIKDKREKISSNDLNQAILGPTLLTRENMWNGVWLELDPLAPHLQINTPLQLN
ncbi:hypothetical protein DAY19_11520 [Halobacteriovorax vibrionivorans]|uniref:Uncharacterized protein n=1 Tax=Halobacteriovorax vibrionivorans TaxID=2152716 RepID=A0ABY0ID86_9BACT|nr:MULTISPECIES: hypothetical protein [Halobacteriovorax]RZF20607.1 hypothetical protein DAY19_11520 [Halobacteriovorax vibrionivorans]TGD47521.1 hypothetical protein EP118_08055 [Halobacteriovorax sp. Y22]